MCKFAITIKVCKHSGFIEIIQANIVADLENMLKLSRLGVIIAPPVMAYYSKQKNLEEMEHFVIGKWFDLLGIENELYARWQ